MKPFEDVSMFDELRRFTAGLMSVEERARLEAELQRDPELARLAANFKAVWLATENGARPWPTSRTEFETIAERVADDARSGGWRRRVAAAILFFGVATIAWFAWRGLRSQESHVVELLAIPWSQIRPIARENAVIPAVLADWSPVQDGQIRWLESLDEARAISAVVSRPIFVYGYIDSCPICQGFQRGEFQDPEIQALLEQTVPVRINLLELEEEQMKVLYTRRYPLLEMQNARGDILHTFPGEMDDVDMRGELARAVAGWAGPNWKLVHDLARLFTSACAAEADGQLAEASRSFAELARAGGPPRFVDAGTAGISRVAAAAARVLETAREEAARNAPDALTRFEAGIKSFEGTPFESDLRAVLHAWREDGLFPVLAVQP